MRLLVLIILHYGPMDWKYCLPMKASTKCCGQRVPVRETGINITPVFSGLWRTGPGKLSTLRMRSVAMLIIWEPGGQLKYRMEKLHVGPGWTPWKMRLLLPGEAR